MNGASALRPFYLGAPDDVWSYRHKAEDVDRRFDRERRERMAEAIRPTSADAEARLEAVVERDALFVTTGQQPGLFTGPLYTIHKALTAVRRAEHLERVLERPVAPLFWIASDDHDWAEANHTHVLDPGNDLHRVALAGEQDAPPHSMARRRLGSGIDEVLNGLAQLLPDTEFAADYLEPLRAAYQPERAVAEAFGDVLADLLAPFDLLMVDAAHPGLKAMATDILAADLERARAGETPLAERTEELRQAGYQAQVPLIPGATNVFFEDEAGRQRLFRSNGEWSLRETDQRIGDDELRELIADRPEAFSANVALRPVVENAVFPTVAYVAGPGETRYYAQLGGLFDAHEIAMPVVVPRPHVTLVESKVRKVLDKFNLGVDDFERPAHEIAARVLREEVPEEVDEALAGAHRALEEGYGPLAEVASEIDPTLEGPVQGAKNSGHDAVNRLEEKIARHFNRQNEVAEQQIAKARVNLFPDGRPQERVLNIYQYLVRYGGELLPALAEAIPAGPDEESPERGGT